MSEQTSSFERKNKNVITKGLPRPAETARFCHHTRQYLDKAFSTFLSEFPMQHGMRSNTGAKPPHKLRLGFFILTSVDAIPIPLLSLS